MRMHTNPPIGGEAQNIFHCLEIVRNSEPGQAPPNAVQIIERAMTELWQRIKADRHAYVMNDTEFGVFNFFRDHYKQGPDGVTSQMAKARYWDAKGR